MAVKLRYYHHLNIILKYHLKYYYSLYNQFLLFQLASKDQSPRRTGNRHRQPFCTLGVLLGWGGF